MTNIELAKWIFTQPIGWIELDIEIDLDSWISEATESIPYLVEHREGDGHAGWTSCCVHGLAVDKTGTDMTAPIEDYHWTELSKQTPVIKKFWQAFPFEHLLRVRFMSLGAGGHIAPHSDSPGQIDNLINHIVPVNIAIIHPDDCTMTVKGHGDVPFKPGRAFLVNITNEHSVVNNSNSQRIHMIGHGLVGNRIEEFSELIVRSYRKQYEHS